MNKQEKEAGRTVLKKELKNILTYIENHKDEFISDDGVFMKIDYDNGEQYAIASSRIAHPYRFTYRLFISMETK